MSDPERTIAELTARLWRLEQALKAHGIHLDPQSVTAPGANRPAPPPTEAAQTVPHDSSEPPHSPSLLSALLHSSHPGKKESIENQIASQWFNRIGILAVLVAAAWFLKLAFENHWIGPLGRVLIGLVAGAALVAWSERFRSRGFPAFSYSLKAVGSGVLYLSLWASFTLYHLLPAGAAFAAMIAVTASNAFMAWVQDAELLAVYAIVGALCSPALLSTGENHEISLFSYLLVLDLSILVLTMLKPWSRLLAGAFAGTAFYVWGWRIEFYGANQLTPTAIFLGLFFLLFAIAPRLTQDPPEHLPGRPFWDQLVGTVMPMANALLGFLGFYTAFEGAGYHSAGPWLAVIFAAFYLLMINLPGAGRLRESRPVLSGLHLVAAFTFLTIAIPLKADGRSLTIGWLAEGTGLFWIETRLRSRLLRVLALICLALGLLSTVVQNDLDGTTPIFNSRFGCYLAAIACMAITAWLALKRPEDVDAAPGLTGKSIAGAAMLTINLLILLAIGWEINSFWWIRSWTGDARMLNSFHMYAQFSYSAFFMMFGAVLLALGFWRRSAFLRWQALVLLAVTIGKVFVSDTNTLSQGYRVLSFLGLGALLLSVSFIYQRDLLRLRNAAVAHAVSEEKT